MAINKKTLFSTENQELATLFKVLGHPARLDILLTLAEKNVCICGEIVEVLPLAQSTVSQHLKELKEAGLIAGEVEGKKSCYCINWEAIGALRAQLEQFFSALEESKQSCC